MLQNHFKAVKRAKIGQVHKKRQRGTKTFFGAGTEKKVRAPLTSARPLQCQAQYTTGGGEYGVEYGTEGFYRSIPQGVPLFDYSTHGGGGDLLASGGA